MTARTAVAGDPQVRQPSAERGYRFLLETPLVPPYFTSDTFAEIWRTWPEPLRSEAERATAEERRAMAFRRYGLTRRPGEASDLPLQFVVTERGDWVPNCFTCHGGQLNGQVIPGLPNTHYALKTLIEESRAVKSREDWTPIDFGSRFIELGTTNGTTNAVVFGIALGDRRDEDLNVITTWKPPLFLHHDMDAPPWWHFSKRQRLYLDGFAEKAHRPLMQFALDTSNGPEKFRQWEDSFRDVYAYLSSLEAPRYPGPIDQDLAAKGRQAFQRVCAECHGSYGENESYPDRLVPWEEIGTDRARLDSLTVADRKSYQRNWFSHYGRDDTIVDPGGYQAPPLDGVWASGPYLHNGSVPTLWHLLRPDQRPILWQRLPDGYDLDQVGVNFRVVTEIPSDVTDPWQRRWYFDTRRLGKSSAGHDFPNQLSEAEKQAVLEYLKTL